MTSRSFHPLAAVAAALALLAHAPAQAAASSSASLTGFTITLWDLNLTDGVTPSITFAGNSYSWAYADNTTPYEYESTPSSAGSGAFDPLSSTATTSQSSSSASSTGATLTTMSGTAPTVVGSLQASGHANGTTGALGYDSSSYQSNASWNSSSSNSFTLSANTGVIFSASAATSAAVTAAYDASTWYNTERAYGSVYLGVWGPGASGNGSQSAYDSLQSDLYSSSNSYIDDEGNIHYLPGSDTKTGTLGAAFVNFTGGSTTGYFYAQTDVNGWSYAAAVPEPETYAMLLAGLGVIGLVGRRRRRPSSFTANK